MCDAASADRLQSKYSTGAKLPLVVRLRRDEDGSAVISSVARQPKLTLADSANVDKVQSGAKLHIAGLVGIAEHIYCWV